MALHADVLFLNGNLLTLEDAMPRAQALAVHRGRIAALGGNDDVKPLADERTRIVDLAGKTLLPGFVDAHTHLLRTGMERTLYVDLNATRSLDDVLQRVQAVASQREAGQWIVGRGWDESGWLAGRYPAKADLDKLTRKHPVALIRVCGHILSVNSEALERVPVKEDPSTVDRAQGWLREESAWGFLDAIEPSLEQRVQALEAGIAHAHALGITSIHEIADSAAIQAYGHLKRQGALTLRVRLNVRHQLLSHLIETGLQGEFGDDFLNIGALKLFSDGSLGARNAALLEPYADDADNPGKLNHEQQDLIGWTRKGREGGFQLMTHAIGDRAIEAVLEAYEAVGIAPQDRARIEHLELPTEKQLERMARRGIIASMQPNFVQWSGPGKLYEKRLGKAREARIDPHRLVLDAKVPLAFSSDSMPVGPLYGMQLAVNAVHPSQRVTVQEAVRAYTLGGAYAGFAEEQMGSLKVGKWADFVALNRDPLQASTQLDQLKVEQTYLAAGRVY